MLAHPSCSSTNETANQPTFGVLSRCTKDPLPVYKLKGIVAEYIDNYEDGIQFHVRFYDTRQYSYRIRLRNEEEIINFIEGDNYNIIEIAQKGSEFPSAVIYRNFENKPIRIKYYTETELSQQSICNEIFHPSWDVAYIRITADQLLENLKTKPLKTP